MKYYNIIAVEM